MSTLHSLIEAWSGKRRDDDPYGSIEDFAEASIGDLWPYAVVHDQIEAGWRNDEYTGALALNLASTYKPNEHAVAAFATLGGRWPANNATTALNLLTLAHRVSLSSESWLDRFVSHASLECLKHGLRDPRPLVSEEAVNIMGGFSRHHFCAATPQDLGPLRDLAKSVLNRIDQSDLTTFLNERVDAVLTDASEAMGSNVICDADARRMLKELERQWVRLAPNAKDAEFLATLKSHVVALAWRYASNEPRAVQVVYVYPAKGTTPHGGWSVMDPWVEAVRSLLKEAKVDGQPTPPKREIAFETLDAMSGSLLVTFRVDADESTQGAITKSLQDAKAKPIVELDQFDDLADLLRRQKIRVRVAHVDADGGSASIAVGPDADQPSAIPYRSKKLTTKQIPQANDLDKIVAVVNCTGRGEAVTMVTIGVTTERQVQYYKAASRLLELISTQSELTRAGWLLFVAKADGKYDRIRAAFEASPCGQAWLEWAEVSRLSEIPKNSADAFLSARSELTGDTVSRRASTLNVWLEALRNH